MILLQANQISKSFGADLILSNIKLEVLSNERVAIVGRNGAGKSTLLKIIVGQLSLDHGEVIFPKDKVIGYLAQDTGLESELSIWDEMLSVFSHLIKLENDIRSIETKMGDTQIIQNEEEYANLLKTYDQLQLSFQNQGGYQYENDIQAVLHGLNFAHMDFSTPISSLSGGQKTRLALGKLLLTKPDLLLLDEPTNHLDIETLSWLEQYLVSYPGSILIVSHDRYFLDKIANKVYEISHNTSTKYNGNYSTYLKLKAERFEQEMKEFKKQQEEIDKLKDFVQRNIARASTTKRAQSRRKQLERMEIKDRPQGDEKSASFSFTIARQSGNDVLTLKDLAIGYEGHSLTSNINLDVKRAESLAIVGPNGIGKSTLLKTIIRDLPPINGIVTHGSNVQIGYYDQEQAKLTSNKNVLQELWDEYPLMPEKEIRTVLGNFLFSGDDVLKGVNELSGGQKARLALAKLMLQNANLLVLDEPTNHLDLESKEVLENALIDYPGTIVFVSHDRYFINRLATRVVELSKDGAESFLGDYDYFLAKKEEQIEIAKLKEEELNQTMPSVTQTVELKSQFALDKQAKQDERKRQRRIDEIESDIQVLEQRIEEIEDLLCKPEYFNDHEKVFDLNEELNKEKNTIENLLQEWEELQS